MAERERAFDARLGTFKRLYRWLNLTLVQHGVWPLAVVLAGAPGGPVAATPWGWWLVRAAAPVAAAGLALAYLRQRPATDREAADLRAAAVDVARVGYGGAGSGIGSAFWWVLPGLALMLFAARMVAGPADGVAKLAVFGVLEAVAFQVVHFGVVRRSFPGERVGLVAAVALFGCSWALGDLFAAAAAGRLADPLLTLGGGFFAGVLVAGLTWAAGRWAGGLPAAVAAQVIVVTLVLGFV